MSHIWLESTIIYQIYPRSFKDSNGDGVGDLQGIIEKLNYLNGTPESLGIDAIWLCPIYTSPMVDFGYDVADYHNIDPLFGSLEDFKRLLSEAHKRNINVMMDFVPNHTSSQNAWFHESKSAKDNPKRDWYIWRDPKPDGSPPNNWLSVFGGSAWEWDESTKQYYLHSFDKEQPDLNWRNHEVINTMLNVLRFWLDLGIDGFRVDVPEWMIKAPHFEDEPPNPNFQTAGVSDPYHTILHVYTFAQPEYLDIVKKFIEVLEKYENKFLVTEIWSPMSDLAKLYSKVGRKWFSPFNFGFVTLPWKASIHKQYINEYDNLVGALYTPNYVLGNHDRPRIASRIGIEQARNAAILLLTLRGMPYIYYGDEIGMTDTPIPPEKIQDPFEKKTPGLGLGRDPQRTPMQWDNSTFAGFSEKEPWLPVNELYKNINVETERKKPDSLFALYKQLIALKRKYKSLQSGAYTALTVDDEDIFAYTRTFEKEIIVVILNYANSQKTISLPYREGRVLCNTHFKNIDKDLQLESITLGAHEGYMLLLS